MSFVTLSVLLVAAMQVALSVGQESADDIAIEELDMATERVIDDVLEEDLAANTITPPDPIDWSVEPEGPPVSFEVLDKPAECAKAAANGDLVELHFTASIKETGVKFDSSYDHEKPIQVVLGDKKRPIRGFDKGLEGICAGERRVVTIPPAWGYGAKGYASIPGDAELLFEVEALRVTTPPPLGNDAIFKDNQSSWSDWIIALLVVGVPVGGAYWGYSKAPKKAKKASTPKQIKKLAAEIQKKKE